MLKISYKNRVTNNTVKISEGKLLWEVWIENEMSKCII